MGIENLQFRAQFLDMECSPCQQGLTDMLFDGGKLKEKLAGLLSHLLTVAEDIILSQAEPADDDQKENRQDGDGAQDSGQGQVSDELFNFSGSLSHRDQPRL